jgi:hypothetical protein
MLTSVRVGSGSLFVALPSRNRRRPTAGSRRQRSFAEVVGIQAWIVYGRCAECEDVASTVADVTMAVADHLFCCLPCSGLGRYRLDLAGPAEFQTGRVL